LTTWHCILSAELTNTHSFRLLFWRFCPPGETLRNYNYIMITIKPVYYSFVHFFFIHTHSVPLKLVSLHWYNMR